MGDIAAFVATSTFNLDLSRFLAKFTTDIMDAWVKVYRHELDQEGVDPDRLLERTYELAGRSRTAAWRLFDGFLARVAKQREVIRGR